jgi:hypothetical protein
LHIALHITCSLAFSVPSVKMGIMDFLGGAVGGGARDYADLKKGSWQVCVHV